MRCYACRPTQGATLYATSVLDLTGTELSGLDEVEASVFEFAPDLLLHEPTKATLPEVLGLIESKDLKPLAYSGIKTPAALGGGLAIALVESAIEGGHGFAVAIAVFGQSFVAFFRYVFLSMRDASVGFRIVAGESAIEASLFITTRWAIAASLLPSACSICAAWK